MDILELTRNCSIYINVFIGVLSLLFSTLIFVYTNNETLYGGSNCIKLREVSVNYSIIMMVHAIFIDLGFVYFLIIDICCPSAEVMEYFLKFANWVNRVAATVSVPFSCALMSALWKSEPCGKLLTLMEVLLCFIGILIVPIMFVLVDTIVKQCRSGVQSSNYSEPEQNQIQQQYKNQNQNQYQSQISELTSKIKNFQINENLNMESDLDRKLKFEQQCEELYQDFLALTQGQNFAAKIRILENVRGELGIEQLDYMMFQCYDYMGQRLMRDQLTKKLS